MDWQLAIDKNREKLLRIILALMASLGLVDGGKLTTLPYYLYKRALRIIRPAEAAVRRLIMMAAYEMELRGFNLSPGVPASGLPLKGGADIGGGGPKDRRGVFQRQNGMESGWATPSFILIDPLKPFTEESPDYSEFGPSLNDESASSNHTPTPATSLGRRLLALKRALETIDKQARRLTRWYAMRDQALAQNHPHRLSPLRPGFPPGYRRKPIQEIEHVLLDCHSLAQYARERRDSS
jgi:hypothetical protein